MIRTIVATITDRGQVTVPAEIRKVLGLKPGDKLAFEIRDGQVRVAPVRFTFEAAFGSVQPISRPEDFNKIIRDAKDERASPSAKRLSEG